MYLRQAEIYELLCLIGYGGQAQAFLGCYKNKGSVIKLYFPSSQALTRFSKEVQILSRLHSNHIVKMIDHYPEGRVTMGNLKQKRPMIVLQLAEHGDLFKIVDLSKLSEDVSRTLFKQLLIALRELKEAQIGHLDIKLQNLLLDQNYNLKLADFGVSKDLTKEPEFLKSKSWGTTVYEAPEIHDKKYKAYDADLFAAGVTLFWMVFQIPPFENTLITNQTYGLIRKGKYQQFWKRFQKKVSVSISLKRMLMKMFLLDPSLRPSLSQLQKEQWLLSPTLSQQQMKKQMQPLYNRLQKGDKETMSMRKALRENINKE